MSSTGVFSNQNILVLKNEYIRGKGTKFGFFFSKYVRVMQCLFYIFNKYIFIEKTQWVIAYDMVHVLYYLCSI